MTTIGTCALRLPTGGRTKALRSEICFALPIMPNMCGPCNRNLRLRQALRDLCPGFYHRRGRTCRGSGLTLAFRRWMANKAAALVRRTVPGGLVRNGLPRSRDFCNELGMAVVKKNAAAVALGRLGGLKGGKARARKLTSKQRAESARKAARAHWGRKRKK